MIEKYASLNSIVAIGFGNAYISCNGEIIYQEEYEDTGFLTLKHFEAIAKIKPNKDWRLVLNGPLWALLGNEQMKTSGCSQKVMKVLLDSY